MGVQAPQGYRRRYPAVQVRYNAVHMQAIPELEDVSLEEEEVALDEDVSLSSLLELLLLSLPLLDEEEPDEDEEAAAAFFVFFCFFREGSCAEACSLASSSDGAMKRGRFCKVPTPRSALFMLSSHSQGESVTELLTPVVTFRTFLNIAESGFDK